MSRLTVLLVYCMLNIRSEEDFVKIKKVFLIENDFWCADQEQLKTDNGYLYGVNIDVEHKDSLTVGFDCFSKTCFYLKSTNLGYVIPRYCFFEKAITSFLRSPEVDKFILIFRFLFTDKMINCNCPHCFEKHKKEIREYVTYKIPEKKSENCISLRCDGIYIRMRHIKEKFGEFLSMDLLKFNEYIKILDEKEEELSKIENDKIFNLHYFENYLECFENQKQIMKDLYYFNLLEDDIFESFTKESSNISIDTTTTLKVSQFKKRFCKKFYENLRKLNDYETEETWKPLLNRYCDYLKDNILSNKLFFPIGGKYDIDYCIEQLSNLIYKSVERIRRDYATKIQGNENFILSGTASFLKSDLEKLQSKIVQDLCEFEYIPKHFSKLLEKEIETLDDYIKIEKIVCDYYNMFVYIVGLYHRLIENSYIPYPYYTPIFIDNYELRIVDGIKIEFIFPTKLGQIKGFNDAGEEVNMIKDTDYFIDKLIVLYCPSDVLKMKNINEIEVISSDSKNNKKFKVNEHLNVY